jgi:predicted membrane protein
MRAGTTGGRDGGAVTTEEDKAWIRSLPLLLVGGVLFCAGAAIFWNKGDTTASIASMTLGIVLVSMWTVSAIVDWHELRKRSREDRERYRDGGAPEQAPGEG